MIEKSRLEELIEQNAIVWHDDYGEIKLANSCEICDVRSMNGTHISWFLCFKYEYNNKIHWGEVDITELEEDLENAKWHYEIDGSRTEYFAPPTWEQFEREHKPYHFINKSGLRETIYIFDKNVNNKLLSAGSKFFGKPTKENYIKACEYARALFLKGEEQ